MVHILDKIVAHKQAEIEHARRQRPLAALQAELESAPPVRDFVSALASQPGVALIAEVKRASPSAGVIREPFDPVQIAATYEQHGAACLSVLTDEQFFGGHLDHLRAVRQAVSIPVLRKDFLLDRYQLLEARVAGADCVLLIAECLAADQLAELYAYAAELGMAALVELYDPAHLESVLALEPRLVGVNNRDLTTFQTDLEHSFRLRQRIPSPILMVSESGIRSRADVLRLRQSGIEAMLVGETLMRAPDIGAKIAELIGAEQDA